MAVTVTVHLLSHQNDRPCTQHGVSEAFQVDLLTPLTATGTKVDGSHLAALCSYDMLPINQPRCPFHLNAEGAHPS